MKRASWLVHSPDREVRVQALAGDIVLCSWARHLTLTVPLSIRFINSYRGEACDGPASHPGGSSNTGYK